MSIPTKQIDGDVAIGRNVTMGGDATVRGNATVDHNLKVKGWLEVKNIKGVNKGLFLNAADLRSAYPNPNDGEWALVSEGLTTGQQNLYLGQVYIAQGGSWVAQTNADGSKRFGGNPTLDCTEYMESVVGLTGEIETVKDGAERNKRTIETMLDTTIPELQRQIDTAAENAHEAANNAMTIVNSKGARNGIAPLDEDGLIPAQYIPSSMDDVKEFDGFITEEEGKELQDEVTSLQDRMDEMSIREARLMPSGDGMSYDDAEVGKEYYFVAAESFGIVESISNTPPQALTPEQRVYSWSIGETEFERYILITLVDRSEEYGNTIYRVGNQLYRHDGTTLQKIGQETRDKLEADLSISDMAKKQLFIDIWNKASGEWGCYNEDTGYFELNGLTDIDYDEALQIYTLSGHRTSSAASETIRGAFSGSPVAIKTRTVFPIYMGGGDGHLNLEGLLSGNDKIEVIRFVDNNLNSTIAGIGGFADNALSLREVYGNLIIPDIEISDTSFKSCLNLETLFLKRVNKNVVLGDCPKLSYESFAYLIQHKEGGTITVTVHPTVYNKLKDETNTEWNELFVDALNKNISFATV